MLAKTENNRTFYAVCLMFFLLSVQWGIATTHLPIYVHELGASPFEVGLVFTIFAGIMIVASPLWGAYSDRLGKRKVFMVFGMIAITPIFLFISTIKEVIPIILMRGSTAIFVGAIQPTTFALVSDISSHEVIGRNMGILNAGRMAGFAIGPITGGLVADYYGFSALWTFVAVICLLGGLIIFVAGSDPKNLKRKDRVKLSISKRTGIISKIFVICVSFPIFILGYSLLGPNLNVYLVEDLRFNRTMVGSMAFVGTGVSTLAQPITGYYSDKYGRKPFLILTAINLILGNIFLYLARDMFLVAIARILISYNNSFQLLSSAYVSNAVSLEEKSGAIGLLNSMGSIAWSLGAAVGGLMITAIGIPSVILIANFFPIISIVIMIFLLKETRPITK